jgi:hypothetical protein
LAEQCGEQPDATVAILNTSRMNDRVQQQTLHGPVAGRAIQVGSLSLVVTPVRGKRRCSWHWQDSAVLHRVNSVIRRGDKFRIDIGVGDGRDEV